MDLGKDEIGSHTDSTLPAYMASDLSLNLEPLLSPVSELDPGTPNKDTGGATGTQDRCIHWLHTYYPCCLLVPVSRQHRVLALLVPQESVPGVMRNGFWRWGRNLLRPSSWSQVWF